jgi:hypothetical protein
MIRDEFERLLSDWLDEPLRADLREIIENAAAENPELSTIRDGWRRVHALTWDKPIELSRLNWEQSARVIAAKIDADAATYAQTSELDALLKLAIAPVEMRVDWGRFTAHLAKAIDAEVDREIAVGPLDQALRAPSAGVAWKRERERIASATQTLKIARPNRARTIRLIGWASGLAAAAAIGWLFIRSTTSTNSADATSIALVSQPSVLMAEVMIESNAGLSALDAESVSVAVVAPDEKDDADGSDALVAADAADDFYFSISAAQAAAGNSAEPAAGM